MSKTILVTGATGNLGSAVTKLLIKEGHQVIGTMTPGGEKPKGQVDFFECDLTSETSTSALFAGIKAKYNSVDAAVMLVGGFGMGNITNSSTDDVMKMFHLNFMTAFNTSQQAISLMNNVGQLKLIFVGAKPALGGDAAQKLPYAISKNAVMKLADIINEDEQLTSVHASVVIPSVIDTSVNRASMPDANFEDWVTPEEIAENISFLISEKANALRGTVLKLYKNA